MRNIVEIVNEKINRLQKSRLIKTYLKKAAIAHNGNNLGDAEKYYQEVLSLDENNYDATLYLGSVYRELRVYSKAEVYYRAAISLDGKKELPYTLLAAQKLLQRKFDDCVKYYQQALVNCKIEKSMESRILYSIGLARFEQGEYELAIEFANKALKLAPKDKSTEALILHAYEMSKMKRS